MTLVPEITCQIEAIADRMIGPDYCTDALREIAQALSNASNRIYGEVGRRLEVNDAGGAPVIPTEGILGGLLDAIEKRKSAEL